MTQERMQSGETRHFYHSFPRLKPGAVRSNIVAKGLAILKSIKEIGLILAPEIVPWSQPVVKGDDRRVNTKQHRISFTELSRSELPGHSKWFGPFSLQFRIDALRRLGALPTIYVPQPLTGDRNFSSVGTVIVSTIGDIKYTVDQLHQLSQLSDLEHVKRLPGAAGATSLSPDCTVNLQNTDENKKVVRSSQVPLRSIKAVLDYIGYKNAPFELMTGVLHAVQNLFYPTDDAHTEDALLQYYRQREWRIIPGLSVGGTQYCKPITASEQKEKLLAIDERFWGTQFPDGSSNHRRVDDAFFIADFEGRHISEWIEKVIVPSDAFSEGKQLFGDRVESAN